MEHTVGHISRLLTEFVTILQTQRSSVDDVRCYWDASFWLYFTNDDDVLYATFTKITTLPTFSPTNFLALFSYS